MLLEYGFIYTYFQFNFNPRKILFFKLKMFNIYKSTMIMMFCVHAFYFINIGEKVNWLSSSFNDD